MPSILTVTLVTAMACGGDGTAGQSEEGGADDPLAAWEGQRPDEPVPVTLTFTEPLVDSAAVLLLDRVGIRPYRAWIEVGGVRSMREVPRTQASSEFLSRLRPDLLAELRMARCAQPGRAAAVLDRGEGADPSAARAVLANLAQLKEGASALAEGAPFIYGVSALGPAEDVREAMSDPRVGRAELADPSEDDGEPPEPRLEAAPRESIPAEIQALSDEEVRERLRAVAEDVEGCGPRDSPPDPIGPGAPPVG